MKYPIPYPYVWTLHMLDVQKFVEHVIYPSQI